MAVLISLKFDTHIPSLEEHSLPIFIFISRATVILHNKGYRNVVTIAGRGRAGRRGRPGSRLRGARWAWRWGRRTRRQWRCWRPCTWRRATAAPPPSAAGSSRTAAAASAGTRTRTRRSPRCAAPTSTSCPHTAPYIHISSFLSYLSCLIICLYLL